MKKKMIALLAAALLTVAFAGNAMAAFENYDLVRIAYQTAGGTAEVATDLGSIASLQAGTAANTTSFITGGTAAGTAFNNTALSNINVVYLAYDTNSSNNPIYVSGGSTPAGLISGTQWGNANSLIQSYYAGLSIANAGAKQVVGSQTAANSYVNNFGTDGSLGLLLDSSAEVNLTGAATQHLWLFSDTVNGSTPVDLGTITTNLNGTSNVNIATNVASTPIPPSFLLMGSGLLGMIGMRRKKA